MTEQRLPKILLVVDGFYPTIGGTELQVELLSEAFQARGHEVQVLAPWLERHRPQQELIRGVKTTRLGYPRIRGIGALFLMARFFFWLVRHRHEYDAIHVHMVKNLATVMGMARPFLRGKIMAAKISGAWEFEGGVLDPALRNRFPWSWMNFFIRRIDYFQTISDFTRQRLLEAGYADERILMIRNGLPIDAFQQARRAATRNAGEVVIGYAGRLEPVKGVEVLVAACGELHQRGLDNFRVDIAGIGSRRDALLGQAQALGIADKVRFLGGVHDMPAFMAGIDIYVQPSHQEGLPNSVMQAMAASLPVVATAVSGNVDLVEPEVNGFLSPAGDAPAMAHNLQRLVDDPALRARFGEASFAAIQGTYALDTVLDQLTAVYRGNAAAIRAQA